MCIGIARLAVSSDVRPAKRLLVKYLLSNVLCCLSRLDVKIEPN